MISLILTADAANKYTAITLLSMWASAIYECFSDHHFLIWSRKKSCLFLSVLNARCLARLDADTPSRPGSEIVPRINAQNICFLKMRQKRGRDERIEVDFTFNNVFTGNMQKDIVLLPSLSYSLCPLGWRMPLASQLCSSNEDISSCMPFKQLQDPARLQKGTRGIFLGVGEIKFRIQ